MKVLMDDGEEAEFGPGDFMEVPPGHDAWIVGNEPCVAIDWQGGATYAKPFLNRLAAPLINRGALTT